MDESFTETQRHRVALRYSLNGQFIFVHNQVYRTTVIDLGKDAAMLPTFTGFRLEQLKNGESVLRISHPGVVAAITNSQ
jgi:hypothetical protein